jgi:rhamnosyltransferase subunit B
MADQKHIVITVLGSLGDLHPMLALGRALKARGHQVTIATAHLYQERIERAGIAFWHIRPEMDMNNPALYRDIVDLRYGPERLARNYILPYLQETLDDLRPVLETADFLLNATLILPGPMLARQLNLPWASVTLQPFGYFSVYDPTMLPFAPCLENVRHFGPLFWRFIIASLHWGSASWFNGFNQLRDSLGIADYGHPVFEGQFSPWLNLALFSPSFAAPQHK